MLLLTPELEGVGDRKCDYGSDDVFRRGFEKWRLREIEMTWLSIG